jgi:hypothetical protein
MPSTERRNHVNGTLRGGRAGADLPQLLARIGELTRVIDALRKEIPSRVHPPARAYLAKRAEGKSNKEAFRCLKRHLVRVGFRALQESVAQPVSAH